MDAYRISYFPQPRKYFDSGDYALSQAGKGSGVGTQHPSPENIPHSNPSQPVAPARHSNLATSEAPAAEEEAKEAK
jgi:hypothetical protein